MTKQWCTRLVAMVALTIGMLLLGVPQAEAAQLWQRAQRASPAERTQIQQRAAQLLQQLQWKRKPPLK